MFHLKWVVASVITLAFVSPCVSGFQDRSAKEDRPFDPVEFIKAFRVGMSYAEVQAALPRHCEQDTLAYLPAEETFLLGVDLRGQLTWTASFKFDTIDVAARRPELLIEFGCSAVLSSRGESFETIVRRVTAAFGEPIEIDSSRERFQQAGWRVPGGSVLTLEYSTAPGNVDVEFVIRKKPRHNLPDSRAVA